MATPYDIKPNETTKLNPKRDIESQSLPTPSRSSELNMTVVNGDDTSSSLVKGGMVSMFTFLGIVIFTPYETTLSTNQLLFDVCFPLATGLATMILDWCNNGGRCKPEPLNNRNIQTINNLEQGILPRTQRTPTTSLNPN